MSTNYYTKTIECPTCSHKPEGIHLGKSSGGWTFSFQYNGGEYYKNYEEMQEWLKDKAIVDEYGNSISNTEFFAMIERKKSEKLNHTIYCREKDIIGSKGLYLIDGHSFSDYSFS